jgi:hypothetical protein
MVEEAAILDRVGVARGELFELRFGIRRRDLSASPRCDSASRQSPARRATTARLYHPTTLMVST